MAKKATPKKSMGGDLMRKTFSPGKGAGNYPIGRSVTMEMYGHHSKPTGGKAKGPAGAKRKK